MNETMKQGWGYEDLEEFIDGEVIDFPIQKVAFLPEALANKCKQGHYDMMAGIRCTPMWFYKKVETLKEQYSWHPHDFMLVVRSTKYPELKVAVEDLLKSEGYERNKKTFQSHKNNRS